MAAILTWVEDLDERARRGPQQPVHKDQTNKPAHRADLAWLVVLGMGALSCWLGIVGLQVLADEHSLTGALAAARGEMVGPAVIITVVMLFLAERVWPAVARPAWCRAHLVDAAYFALFAIAVVPLLTLVETGFAVEIDRHVGFLELSRLGAVPRIVVIALILLATDAMNWCAHVANHRSASMWRLHALHHSQEEMSVFTTFRTHPLVHASYLPAVLPALFLGASGSVPGFALVAYGCFVALAHSNLRWSFGKLGHVVVSPAYHRIHHVRAQVSDRGAVNFGFVLCCWDQLARRAVYPTRGVERPTGLIGRPVPIEQDARQILRTLLMQLGQPFVRSSAIDGSR